MATLDYLTVRSLELEGRQRRDTGAWPLTVRRLEAGEGVPAFPCAIEVPDDGSLPPTPRIPLAHRVRSFWYRRLRSSIDCEQHLRKVQREAPVCLHLTADWVSPPDGVI